MKDRWIIGCMSGTSMDAIDAALVRITGTGLGMRAEFVKGTSEPLLELGKLLRPISRGKRMPAADFVRYAVMIGMSHLVAIRGLLKQTEVRPHAIGVHGQTLFHEVPNSMQLINPHPIAQEFGVPVAFDFRGADLAAGGNGAPITPLADHILYRHATETRAVLNLGGFSNYTWLPASRQTGEAALASIRGGDICACNLVLDYVARRWLGQPYDPDGQGAANGIVHPEAEQFLEMMLSAQAGEGRSLGSGDEAINWARSFQHHCSGEDLAATACAVIGKIVAEAIGEADRIVLAGGGACNRTLIDGIRVHTSANLTPSDDLGVPMQFREPVCMAVLTALAEDRVPITLPQVTNRFVDAPAYPCWIHP